MTQIAGFGKVGVIGSGQMGAGIAQVMAAAGLDVTLQDINSSQLETAKSSIRTSAEKLASKGVIDATAKANIEKCLRVTTDIDALASSDLVIEAIVENERIKCDLFSRLDKLAQPNCVFATNTSSIPITRLAAATSRPDKFIGMHFMNPVPIMKLVEIIPGMATSEQTTTKILELSKAIGKETSRSQDYPGFVVNRILMPMINEAFNTLLEGVASAADIDKGMKLGTNQPMGPLQLADFIGLDTCYAIMRVLHEGLGDPRYRPSPLLAKYVEAGWLGKKTKRGVYQY
jgi:3-hydroxybutyryl-CoA dehydrogenase